MFVLFILLSFSFLQGCEIVFDDTSHVTAEDRCMVSVYEIDYLVLNCYQRLEAQNRGEVVERPVTVETCLTLFYIAADGDEKCKNR